MKKILIISWLIIGHLFLKSCCYDGDVCFEFNPMEAKHYSMKYYFEFETDMDTIEANDYAVLIDSEMIDKVCLNDFVSGSNLYAYSCEESKFILTNQVRNISIKSSSDLTPTYTAGSDLKELFSPTELDVECLDWKRNTDRCLKNYLVDNNALSLEDAFNKLITNASNSNYYSASTDVLSLLTMETEEEIIANNHQLTIKFDFEDGNTVTLVTNRIHIK